MPPAAAADARYARRAPLIFVGARLSYAGAMPFSSYADVASAAAAFIDFRQFYADAMFFAACFAFTMMLPLRATP